MLSVLAVLQANAQCTLSFTGHLFRAGSAEKIAGATVMVKETGHQSISDSTGVFRLDNLCSGTYTLLVTAVSYDSTAIRVVVNKSQHKDLFIRANSTQLTEVEVRGERKQDIATNAHSEIKGLQLLQ